MASDIIVKDSNCFMCDAACKEKITVENGRLTSVEMVNPDISDLCPRWKAQIEYLSQPDRLRFPLKRTGKRGEGKFTRISWDDALDTVARELLAVKTKYGPESVVFYIGHPKEPRPYYRRLAHLFGSPNYCTESSNCASSAMIATQVTYGKGFMMGMGLDTTARCHLIWSTSIRNNEPTGWKQYTNIKANNTKLIVVDPLRTKLASMADIFLQLRPGTDGALALGMLNVIIENDLYDTEFVNKWTTGFDELIELVKKYPASWSSQITGVPEKLIIDAARMFATAKPARIKTSPDATTHSTNGFQNQRAILLIPAITGNIDLPGSRSGGPGGPGMVRTNNIELMDRLLSLPRGLGTDRFPLWTTYADQMESNIIADSIDTAKPYPIKALFGAGMNADFFPNSLRFYGSVKKLDFVVVTEQVHNSGTALADIVLPIATPMERPVLSTMGTIKLTQPVIKPPGEIRPEWTVFAELAKRMGFGDEFWNGDFEKCVDYILEPTGITVADLKQHPEGIEPERSPRQTTAAQPAFQTPSGKIELKSSVMEQYGYNPLPVYEEPVESPLSQPEMAGTYPLVLTTGARSVIFFHSRYRQLPTLRKMMPEPLADINPVDAEIRGIKDSDDIEVSTIRSVCKFKAHVTDDIKAGVVSIPHGWPEESNVNALIDDMNLDPISGFGPFKAQLCQVKKI